MDCLMDELWKCTDVSDKATKSRMPLFYGGRVVPWNEEDVQLLNLFPWSVAACAPEPYLLNHKDPVVDVLMLQHWMQVLEQDGEVFGAVPVRNYHSHVVSCDAGLRPPLPAGSHVGVRFQQTLVGRHCVAVHFNLSN